MLSRSFVLGMSILLASVLAVGNARSERASFLYNPPAAVQAGKNFEIVGNIVGTLDIAKARCRYRQRDGAWKQVELALEYADVYRAIIPAHEMIGPTIEYYCIGFDYFGAQTELYKSASAPRRVRVTGKAPALDVAAKDSAKDPARDSDRAAAALTSDRAGPSPRDRPQTALIGDRERQGTVSGSRSQGGEQGGRASSANVDAAQRSSGRVGKLSDEGKLANRDETGSNPVGASVLSERDERKTSVPPASEGHDYAKSDAETSEETALFSAEDVVSLATLQAQAVSEAPAIASVVSDEQMRVFGMRTLPEALKTIPGFETSRDVQGFWRAAVRGIRDEASLLVLFDGHRLNNPYDSKALLNIPTDNIERIEAIRGPGSALHGAGAFLGVLNLIPKRREGFEATVSGGSFKSADGHLSAGTRLGSSFYAFLDGDVVRTDGYRAEIKSDRASTVMEGAGLKAEDAPAGKTDDHRFFANVGSELRYAPAGGAKTKLSARYFYEDRGALVGLFDTVGNDSKLKWNVALIDLSEEIPLGAGSFLSGRAFFDRQETDRLFQIAPKGYPIAGGAPNGLFERTHVVSQNIGGEISVDVNVAQTHKLTLGVLATLIQLPKYSYELDLEKNVVLSSPKQPDGYYPRQNLTEFNKRLEAGAFAQYLWRISPALSLILGARLDITELPNVKVDGTGQPVLDSSKQVITEGTRLEVSVNPRLGLVWTPLENLNFKLLYGRAFRAPTIEELAEHLPSNDFNDGRFEGNPSLKQSIIDTFEAGLETIRAVGENRVRLRGNGFFNYYTNPISAVDESGNITPLSNRDSGVMTFGVEAEVRFEVSSRAYTFLNYSWFRAIDRGTDPEFELLTDVPQYRLNWALQIPLGHWINFSLLAQAGAERRNNSRSKLEAIRTYRIPAYILFGSQLRTERILEHYELALSAQNLFNYDLKDDVPRPDGSRMPGLLPREGFGAWLTARASF